jgi:signal transduction histidine kinase
MLAAFVPLLLAMAAAWAIATAVFSSILEQRVADRLTDAARVLTETGLPYTAEVLRRLADLQQASILLFDADGTPVMRAAGPLPPSLVGQLRPPMEAGTASHVEIAGEPLVVIARPLAPGPDGRSATVLVAGSLRDAREAAYRAALGMGAAVLGAGLLLVVLQYLLVRGVTEPVRRLVAMANGIAAGQRDLRAETTSGGELAALAQALNDMTERLASYEAELAERSRFAALGEMGARIAHEIRNPLTGLKLHLELLAERARPDQSATVARLLDEVNRLELIVASSLSLTSAQRAAPQATDPVAVVEEVLHLMEPSLRHRHIELQRRLTPLSRISLDRDRFKQLLLNLLVNAADALPAGGIVLVATTADPAQRSVTVSVEDSGPGYGDQAAIAGAGHGSRKPFGLGLGLRLCREIVAEHNGRLELGRSEALGGARATIELPADTIPA